MRLLKFALAGALAAPLFLAAGCAEAPAPDAYAAPTDSEAMDAYKRFILAQHREGSSSEKVEQRLAENGGVDGTNYYAINIARAREDHNERVQKVARNLQSAKPSDCVWEKFKPGAVKAKYDEKAFGPAPEAAYRCKVAVVLDTDKRGLVEGPTEAFLFKTDDGFVFVGKPARDFKRLDGKEDEPEPKKTHGGSQSFS